MAEVVAETGRLVLRTWDPGDPEEFERLVNTPAVMRWLGGVQSAEDHRAAFERLDGYQRDFGHTFWIVERKADRAMLGFCGLKRVNAPGAPNPGEFEVGWRLREDSWGQGIAKEAAIASLDLGFSAFGYDRIIAMTIPPNEASAGLMKRLGMTRREELDFTDERFGPELNPAIIYSLDAREWPAARAAALG